MEQIIDNKPILCDLETSQLLQKLGFNGNNTFYKFIRNPRPIYGSEVLDDILACEDDAGGTYCEYLGDHVYLPNDDNDIFPRYELYNIQKYLISMGYEIAIIYFQKGYLWSNNPREKGNTYKIDKYYNTHDEALQDVIKVCLKDLLIKQNK